jgi:glycogen operon protein
LEDAERGRFAGMANGAILSHLKALGITSLELMPVHTLFDEPFLQRGGRRNFWGYNAIQFFTPDARFAGADPVGEFRDMVRAIHDAGIEVFLDVVYNHTGEGDERGATLSFRGLDNLGYYRTEPGDPGRYVNDSGTGNILDADHPQVQGLVVESLVYWHREMGVDGFRFDLATILGRSAEGFRGDHPLLQAIATDSRLRGVRLIAEPWDPGPGGYQLGAFPAPWSEWNDRYRDSLRRFWRGDDGQAGELARRLHGSADYVEHKGIGPVASINFVTSHDGFTLMDLVSYRRRHNRDNGEDNLDGHAHNYSANYGVEGPGGEAQLNRLRRRQRLNLLASLFFSQGTPMLLAGDEAGNSQGGNNNAYSQDNETGWVDWSGLEEDPAFVREVARLARLRRQLPLLNLTRFLHGQTVLDGGAMDIRWLRCDGWPMNTDDWKHGKSFALHLEYQAIEPAAEDSRAVVILFNASQAGQLFRLPDPPHRGWQVLFTSADNAVVLPEQVTLPGRSIMLLGQQGENQ